MEDNTNNIDKITQLVQDEYFISIITKKKDLDIFFKSSDKFSNYTMDQIEIAKQIVLSMINSENINTSRKDQIWENIEKQFLGFDVSLT